MAIGGFIYENEITCNLIDLSLEFAPCFLCGDTGVFR